MKRRVRARGRIHSQRVEARRADRVVIELTRLALMDIDLTEPVLVSAKQAACMALLKRAKSERAGPPRAQRNPHVRLTDEELEWIARGGRDGPRLSDEELASIALAGRDGPRASDEDLRRIALARRRCGDAPARGARKPGRVRQSD